MTAKVVHDLTETAQEPAAGEAQPVFVGHIRATPEGGVRITYEFAAGPDRMTRAAMLDLYGSISSCGPDPDDVIAWEVAARRMISQPSDERIVEVLDARLRAHDALMPINFNGYVPLPVVRLLNVDGYTITRAEAFEARRRLLAVKVKASDDARREADRRMVLGPIDDPDEA